MLNLRVGRGLGVTCILEPEPTGTFDTLLNSDQPALFGSFHFGASDLLGYLLSERGRRVSIIRLQVENATDTRLLGERFGGRVSFLWLKDPANLLFDVKAAIEAGESLALKCDRLDASAEDLAHIRAVVQAERQHRRREGVQHEARAKLWQRRVDEDELEVQRRPAHQRDI